MKKLLSLGLALAMAFSVTACSSGGGTAVPAATTDVSEAAGASGESSEAAAADTQQSEKPAIDYPTRPIELVIPFGAAGSADICFRQVGEIMSDMTGVSINANNLPGAGGVTGLTYAYEQEADGYTICAITPSMPIAEAKGTFAFTDEFVPVALMEMDIFVVSVIKDNGNYSDLESMIAYAKEHPGELTIGGTSSGGLDEYEALQFAENCGIELTFVPYDSGGEMKSAFLGGELNLYMDKLSSFTSMMQYDEVQPIVVINDVRVDADGLRDVPCTVEKGINFTTGSWRGLVVRRDTPQEIVHYLSALCKDVYESDAFQQVLENDNANLSYGYMNSEEFAALIASEVEAYKEVVSKYSN